MWFTIFHGINKVRCTLHMVRAVFISIKNTLKHELEEWVFIFWTDFWVDTSTILAFVSSTTNQHMTKVNIKSKAIMGKFVQWLFGQISHNDMQMLKKPNLKIFVSSFFYITPEYSTVIFYIFRGKGDYYRLGHGTELHQRFPVCVHALESKIITQISCGSLHCVVSTDDGEVYCWGDNDEGQLGDGTINPGKLPKQCATLQVCIALLSSPWNFFFSFFLIFRQWYCFFCFCCCCGSFYGIYENSWNIGCKKHQLFKCSTYIDSCHLRVVQSSLILSRPF